MEPHRFCVQCGNSLSPQVRFCGSCGTPAEGTSTAPAGERQVNVASSAGNLTDSDILYLHGELFAEQGGWRRAEITLESSGRKVQKEELANRLILAAATSLAKEGWIRMATVGTGFIFRSDLQLFQPISVGPYPRGGLESALFATLRNDQKSNSVERVVVSLVGGEKGDPWEEIVNRVRDHLAATGYLMKTENPAAHGLGKLFRSSYIYAANPRLVASSIGEVARVQSNLVEVQSWDPHGWQQVIKKIRKALTSCLPSTYDDSPSSYDDD